MNTVKAVFVFFGIIYMCVCSVSNGAYLSAALALLIVLIDLELIDRLENKLRLYKRIYTDLKDVVAGF